jgi:hypothetical protein
MTSVWNVIGLIKRCTNPFHIYVAMLHMSRIFKCMESEPWFATWL